MEVPEHYFFLPSSLSTAKRPCHVLSIWFMMYLRGLVLFTWLLPGIARRSVRLDLLGDDVQKQNRTLTKALDVAAEMRQALLPAGFRTLFRVRGPQARTSQLRAEHFEAPSLHVGPRRATVALHAGSGPGEDQLPPEDAAMRLRGGALACAPALPRRGLLVTAAVAAAALPSHAAQAAAPRPVRYASEDGAMHFSVPASWQIEEQCSPSSRQREPCESSGRRTIVAARRRGGGAEATATIDLGAYGKCLRDFGTVDEVGAALMAGLPESAKLREASVITTKGGFANYYVYKIATGRSERLVKIGVRQSRLYTLTVQLGSGVTTIDEAEQAELRAEAERISASFEAFPVSSLRGGLISSDAPAVIRSL